MFLNQAPRPTAKHYIILSLTWAGWLFDFYDLFLFSFLLIQIEDNLRLSKTQLSLLIGVSLAATAAGGLIFGYLADRIGRKAVLMATIVTYSIGTFCCGLAGGMTSLLVCRIITGLGVGGEWATGQTLIGETFPARIRGRFAAVIQTGAPAGIALATLAGAYLEPVLAHSLGSVWGWRACFFVSVIPAIIVVIIIALFMPESDIWEQWRRARAPGVHPSGTSGETAGGPAGEGTGGTRGGGDFFAALRSDKVIRRLFLLGLILALTDMSAYWFTYSWMPKYLFEKLHFSLAKSGGWMLVTQAGGLLGYLSFGVVADWKGRRLAYTIYSLIWAVGLFCVTWFWGVIVVAPGLTLLFMFLVGVGTGNFSGYGPIFAELFPTRIRNTAMGAAFNLARGVQFFTPLVITWVATRPWLSPERALGIGISIGAFFALATGAWVWTLPETRGTTILVDEVVREEAGAEA